MISILPYIFLAIGAACFAACAILVFRMYGRAKIYDKEVREKFGDGTDNDTASEQDVAYFQKMVQEAFIKPLNVILALAVIGLVFIIAGMVLKGFLPMD